MAGLRAAKQELRTLIRHKLSQLSADSIKQQSTVAVESLLALPEYKNARRIGIYLSMPDGEVSTKDVVHDALREGKRVFVPYIYKCSAHGSCKPRSVMDMVSLHSLSDYQSLFPDAWGIPSVSRSSIGERHQILDAQTKGMGQVCPDEPSNSGTGSRMKIKETQQLDVIVMPGVAFDRDLGRLGHGKGFYDYFLDRYRGSLAAPMPFLVGLSLDVQLLSDGQSVPTDASDYTLNALVVGDGTVIGP